MKIKKGFELRVIAGESVIIATGAENIDFSRIISLNSSAAYLWQQVSGTEFSVETLAAALESRYDVEPQQALEDSRRLAGLWLENGIVEQ